MPYNTGNAVPSKDPRDLVDNAEKMDDAVNGTGDSWTDRLGNVRPTLKRLEDDYPNAGIDADRAEVARDEAVAAQGDTEDARDEAVAAKNAAQSSELAAAGHESAAQGYAGDAEGARDVAVSGVAGTYADTAAGLAATSEGDYFNVPSSDDGEVYIVYRHAAGAVAVEEARTPSAFFLQYILSGQGKNLVDKKKIRRGFYVSPGAGSIVASSLYRCTGFIPVTEGEVYAISGGESGVARAYGFSDDNDSDYVVSLAFSGSGFTIPSGVAYLVANVTNDGQDITTYDETIQIEKGFYPTDYSPYEKKIPISLVSPEAAKKSELIELVSFNKVDPARVNFIDRFSEGTGGFTVDTLGIAASDWIPVDEGEIYTLSGEGVFSPENIQGGYFSEYGATSAIQNISDYDPVSGSGRTFQVPEGLGITHVVVSLRKLNDDSAEAQLHGDVQLEPGELATPFQPYSAKEQIKRELIPASSELTSAFNEAAWYRFTEGDEGATQIDKIPGFRGHWIAKDKDLVVVNTGTSLTARSAEHCTDHPYAATRPPLMHSNNMVSILWDKMRWEGQQYRRYDAVGFFTEAGGTFLTDYNVNEWDDNVYRQGWTRYSEDSGASTAFEVPAGAWQFNFIYRTDSTGCPDPVVTVSEGDGVMEVFDEGTATWVEANGYVFSMLEAAAVTRTIVVPRASDDVDQSLTLASKGNTTYQKRLKMRCKSGVIDSRASVKNVTVSGQSAGRFMYWGVEWSVREFMITYINAARGSHNTQADHASGRGLPLFQDNEVWSFRPDLLFFELPIHNDGAASSSAQAGGIFERLTNNFVFRTDYELSLSSRAAFWGLAPEFAMFNSSISWNFGGIEDDGSIKIEEQLDGSMLSALDKYNQAFEWVKQNHPEVVFINSVKRWVDAGVLIFGDLRSATEGSGKSGATFTNEGSHWNDTGSKIIAKTLTPLFAFIV